MGGEGSGREGPRGGEGGEGRGGEGRGEERRGEERRGEERRGEERRGEERRGEERRGEERRGEERRGEERGKERRERTWMKTTHRFIKAVQEHLLCLQQLRLRLSMRFHSCVRTNKNTAYNPVPTSFPGGMSHMTYRKSTHVFRLVLKNLIPDACKKSAHDYND